MTYKILEADKFKNDLEEAAFWLYTHNLEQSQNFAGQKFLELQKELTA